MPVLNWLGKDKIVNHHNEVPYKVLNRVYSYDKENGKSDIDNKSKNMIIHGDNLLALKSLMPKYEGMVDVIYIDPPYNTAHSTNKNQKWVYSDNVDSPIISKWLNKVVGDEGEDLSRHDKWLCMMYPRLQLLHKLLSNKGIIFISIDDNEFTNLKFICDEIFNKDNFISVLHWKRKKQPSYLHGQVASVMEYILIYSKNKDCCEKLSIDNPTDSNTRIDNATNQNSERIIKEGIRVKLKDISIIKAGIYKNKTMQTEYLDDVVIKEGRTKNSFRAKAKFRDSQERINRFCDEDVIFITKNLGFRRDKLKEDLEKRKAITDLLLDWGDNQDSDEEIRNLFSGDKPFDYPKPSKLISNLIKSFYNEDAIVLDSFAGSGTTAHAVLDLNNKDGGNRQFILVEMEDYADSITAERVKRVIDGYGSGKDKVEGLNGDFSYYELGDTIIENGVLNENVNIDTIKKYIYWTETKEEYYKNENEPYYLGTHNETSYYMFYEKDKISTLDFECLKQIKTKSKKYVIYADILGLTNKELEKYNITFKKIPRDIKKL